MEIEAIIGRFVSVARPIMLRWFSKNSCIHSTRTTIDVMNRFGLRARELSVQMVLENQRTNCAMTVGLTPESKASAMVAAGSFDDRCLGGVDWEGHLVAVVEDVWWIDPSLDQAEEVAAVPPEPFCFKLPNEGVDVDDAMIDLGLTLDDGTPLRLRYAPHPENVSYRGTEAWNDSAAVEMASITIERAMLGLLIDEGGLTMFVVYQITPETGRDHAVRRCRVRFGKVTPDEQSFVASVGEDELGKFRANLVRIGMQRLSRFMRDDPAILEVWM